MDIKNLKRLQSAEKYAINLYNMSILIRTILEMNQNSKIVVEL